MSALNSVRMKSEQFLMMGEDPPGVKLELAHGEVVLGQSPSPVHSWTLLELIAMLLPYIKERKLAELLADTDTVFDVFNTRRPDLGFVSRRRGNLVREKAVMGAPDLCVEIVSPGSERIDRRDKFGLFEKHGVKHSWIVDPEERTAEAFELRRGEYELVAGGRDAQTVYFPPFAKLAIPLGKLWRPRRGREG
jgi:Uma2 family endonuclease